ncbi:MAG: hypothetical protein HYX86_05625 [Chloroflexi bacterium]|nr:hypothetical protein [Chloroflexota bacterium]
MSPNRLKKLLKLTLFAIAFGYIEAIVVIYVRRFAEGWAPPPSEQETIWSLGFIALISNPIIPDSTLLLVEQSRQVATIIMLVAVSWLATKSIKERIFSFLWIFSLWDLSYYLFLKVWLNWPNSILDTNIYFLVPMAWVGPVATPLALFTALALLGGVLLLRRRAEVQG